MDKYDSAPDTLKHIEYVRTLLSTVSLWLEDRGQRHDASKLLPPEKEMFDIFRPKLDHLDINSSEYKQALVDMGDALKHHYAENPHHPECHKNGVDGMNLLDIIEMTCDWIAAADRGGKEVDMEWASKRFKIDSQLRSIIENTVKSLTLKG